MFRNFVERNRFAERSRRAFVTCSLVALTAAVTVAASAHAEESADNKDVVPTISLFVPFEDLNLNKYEGAVTMYDRLHVAAKRVCGSLRGATLRDRSQYEGCVDRAVQTSIAKLDRPVLSRYAEERSGKPGAPRVASGQQTEERPRG